VVGKLFQLLIMYTEAVIYCSPVVRCFADWGLRGGGAVGVGRSYNIVYQLVVRDLLR
jgi:hypothetical protein